MWINANAMQAAVALIDWLIDRTTSTLDVYCCSVSVFVDTC